MSNYTLRQALEMCRDYLSCIPESAAGGDDDAVRLTRIATGALGAADDEPQCEAGFGINGEQLSWLLISSLKSDEIAGPPEVRQKRVRELLHWFVRLTQGWANPKWLYGHAMELAYHIATNDVNRGIDLSAIEQGAELSDEEIKNILSSVGPTEGAPRCFLQLTPEKFMVFARAIIAADRKTRGENV